MELTLGAALGVGEICYSKYYWTIHRDTWPKFLKESGSRKGGALFLEVSGNPEGKTLRQTMPGVWKEHFGGA